MSNYSNKKEFIISIFQNTNLDSSFIEVATALGYRRYFKNLNLDSCKINLCYDRVVEIVKIINPRLLNK